MHFAVGMCGGAALTLAPCLILRRGWRFIPVGMTLGGIWGLIPDMPRLWREDFTGLPFASTLGDKDFELWLHSIGDLFFLHQSLDAQPKEFALLGLAMIIGLYNLSLMGLLYGKRKVPGQSLYKQYDRQPDISSNTTHGTQIDSHQIPTGHERCSHGHDSSPVIGHIGIDKSA